MTQAKEICRRAKFLLARDRLVKSPLRLIGIGVSTLVPPAGISICCRYEFSVVYQFGAPMPIRYENPDQPFPGGGSSYLIARLIFQSFGLCFCSDFRTRRKTSVMCR